VEIVEDEHEGLTRRQALEQLAHRAVTPVALVWEGGGAGYQAGQRWQDTRQLDANVVVQGLEAMRREAGDVFVERVDERPERQIPFEFPRGPREHELAASVGPARELRQESGLADARFAHECEHRRVPPLERPDYVVEQLKLSVSSHEVFLEQRHPFRRGPTREPDRNNQGVAPMPARPRGTRLGIVPGFLLHHRHEPQECGVVYGAFRGYCSPLRHQATLASCRAGGHEIWWTVDAASEEDALALLPFFVAERTTAAAVSQVDIP
jgi:hypothetical protein